jgi:phosphopantothenoylcysteine decarboxylase / phosphopantothenate---cysteine ligase
LVERDSGLSGRRILLGVTGSIAAYKAVDVVRRLSERGAEVRVAMTMHATRFVSPLTFEVLSGKPVLCDEFGGPDRPRIGHIDITDELDAMIIAPATANCIGKIASGIADDALTSAVMALDRQLFIAPAMNDRMFRNPILAKNIRVLRETGVKFIEPGTGSLACGTIGRGRLADVDEIVRELSLFFTPRDLKGKTVLVTAGPTREFIDAVRFISNPSTGTMGYAIAVAARDRGADVVLVSGPTQHAPPRGVTMVNVTTAAEMHDAVKARFADSNVVIMSAAVSDFKPTQTAVRKIKKNEANSFLELERTADILKELGGIAGGRLLVGFAAETEDVEQNAIKKLREKRLDLIVVNDLLKTGAGFGTGTNSVVIIDREGKRTELPVMPKSDVALRILDAVVERLNV